MRPEIHLPTMEMLFIVTLDLGVCVCVCFSTTSLIVRYSLFPVTVKYWLRFSDV